MTGDFIKKYIDQTTLAMAWINANKVAQAANILKECSGTVWVCGNGGSASLAEHFAQDLAKQAGVRAIALTNLAYVTALANDVCYRRIFSDQIYSFCKLGDILVLISGSGNSENILDAACAGHDKGTYVIGITGFSGGKLRQNKHLDLEINVPANHMGRSEDGHLCVCHAIVYGLMEDITNE